MLATWRCGSRATSTRSRAMSRRGGSRGGGFAGSSIKTVVDKPIAIQRLGFCPQNSTASSAARCCRLARMPSRSIAEVPNHPIVRPDARHHGGRGATHVHHVGTGARSQQEFGALEGRDRRVNERTLQNWRRQVPQAAGYVRLERGNHRRSDEDEPLYLLAGCRGAAGQSGWYSSAEGEARR